MGFVPRGAPGSGALADPGSFVTWRKGPAVPDPAQRTRGLEPYVGDDIVSVSAPAFMVSPRDGQLRGDGVGGVYTADRRVLSGLVLTVDGCEPEPIHSDLPSGDDAAAGFVAAHRLVADPGVGVVTVVERLRRLAEDADDPPAVATEQVTVRSYATETRRVRLRMWVAADLADISEVRSGRPVATVARAEAVLDGVRFRAPDGLAVTVRAVGLGGRRPADDFGVLVDSDGTAAELVWDLDVPAGSSRDVTVRVGVHGPAAAPPVVRAVCKFPWQRPHVEAADERLTELLRRGLADLESLLLSTPERPADAFVAAGSPWYLTLFGRDSLWSARMMLPLGTGLARGTLRTLAHLQGTETDPVTEEEPGKIIHELRRTATVHSRGLALPARYYGSVDATPLFVILLAEAWRWGMPEADVRALLPAAVRALGWLGKAVPEGGFLSYRAANGAGLSNQGWKDSADAVRFADGTLARAPIALAEAQAYAYQAALCGADLLEALDGSDTARKDAAKWRAWAADLRTRFRDRFWLADAGGSYPAIALDGAGEPVSGAASNMGHLLGTGLLDPEESERVAHRLGAEDLTATWGLRTLSCDSAGYNPLGYHTGSIWAHDTAIAVRGLAAAGHHAEAARLIEGLLAAGVHFGYRLPELWGGEERGRWPSPIPYPAACRPQAWAAASAVALLHALIGLYPDVPRGTYRLAPLTGDHPYGIMSVAAGLLVGGEQVTLERRDGVLTVMSGLAELKPA